MHDHDESDKDKACAQDHLWADLEPGTIVLIEPHYPGIAVSTFANLPSLCAGGETIPPSKRKDHNTMKAERAK